MNATERSEWLGHPRGLSTLFFTEMWERFSYYGMRSLLILFMVAPAATGGLGFPTKQAASLYGFYTMGVYALSIPGGWIADRFLGHYRAVLYGGVLIMLGHFSMAFPSVPSFFTGLGLIVVGTGLLKPNVSTMVGLLYRPDDARRDAGFSIYYMGINLGAMIAPLVCGFLGQRVNWHLGFAAAGIGMLLGLIQYLHGSRHLADARNSWSPRPATDGGRERPPLHSDDWRRLGLIGVFFVFAVIFWSAFEQAGSTLTLFADRHTRLSLLGFSFPSSWFQSEQPLFVILLAPVFAWLWMRLGRREPSGPAKFAMGLLLVSAGYFLLIPAARLASTGVKVSPMWLTCAYLLHTFGELCLSPVGLRLVTKLSPRRLVGAMMGVWFLGAAIGNFIAGWIAGFSDEYPLFRIFTFNALLTLGAAIALALMVRPILAVTAERGATSSRRDAGSATSTAG
ncbi:MAG TPA: peptide MFS transporter [Thermoanaerobaculia bacterium]|nr:peptide MFS transporter [Thermoanaerobaculia bacterium]